jgi:protein O-GlcNAc transferase
MNHDGQRTESLPKRSLTIPGFIPYDGRTMVDAMAVGVRSTILRFSGCGSVSMDIADMLAQAFQRHQLGDLAGAEMGYRQLLKLAPDQPDAWHLLGVIENQRGNSPLAITYLEQALNLAPGQPDFLGNLGIAYAKSGHLPQAERAYLQAIRSGSRHAEVAHGLGNVYATDGRWRQAIDAFQQALRINPDFAPAYDGLANAACELGDYQTAHYHYQQAISRQPDQATFYRNQGHAFRREARWQEAATAFTEALRRQPLDAQLQSDLGNVLQELGETARAIEHYQEAIRQRPLFAIAYSNLGNAYLRQGDLTHALQAVQIACQQEPGNLAFRHQLGAIYHHRGQLLEALQSYQQVLADQPQHYEAQYNLAQILQRLERPLDAIAAYERCLAIKTDSPSALAALIYLQQQLADWKGIIERSQTLIEAVDTSESIAPADLVTPLSFLALPIPTTARQQQRCSRRWMRGIGLEPNPFATARQAGFAERRRTFPHRLRVAYFSGDFQEHPVAYAIVDAIEQHDRERFEILAYSYGKGRGQAMRQRIEQAVDVFQDVESLSVAEIVERMHKDRIDILVDLQGHTQNARTAVLARRPAPLQLGYLGYAGTLGGSCLDAVLCDDYVVPKDQQAFYDEQLYHLPGCFLMGEPFGVRAPLPDERTRHGLPRDHFVFCAFHNTYKLTPSLTRLWGQLLAEVPQSCLWLQAGQPIADDNLRQTFARHGIHHSRLIFAPRVERHQHVVRHGLADLFLDAYPYNAHTTAADVLRMNLPLVTLSGSTFVSRVAGSLLRQLGLEDLIAHSLEDYYRIAISLATSPATLANTRRRLQSALAATDLYDGAALARKLENAYLRLWQRS